MDPTRILNEKGCRPTYRILPPQNRLPISLRTGTVTVIRSPTRFPRDKSDAHPVHLISLSLRMTSARYKHYQRHKGAWDVPIVHCVKLNVSRHRSVSHIIVFRKWTCDTEILDRFSLTLFVFLRPRFHLPHGLPHLQGRWWQGDDNCSSQSVGALLRRRNPSDHILTSAHLCVLDNATGILRPWWGWQWWLWWWSMMKVSTTILMIMRLLYFMIVMQ